MELYLGCEQTLLMSFVVYVTVKTNSAHRKYNQGIINKSRKLASKLLNFPSKSHWALEVSVQ